MSELTRNSNDDELLSAYIDGELTDAERAAVEARLESDPAARELVAEMRSLSGTLKSLPREALSEDMRSAVLKQIDGKQVALPPVEFSWMRRLMWPAVAIAAALMLIFISGDELREIDDIAKVEGRDGRAIGDVLAADKPEPAFEGPETDADTADTFALPAASAPREDEAHLADTAAEPAREAAGEAFAERAVRSELAEEAPIAARRVIDELAAADAELGVVHLTLTDFRSGAEKFNRLLVSNGVQLVDGESTATRRASGAAAGEVMTTDTAAGAGTLSRRSAAPAAGFGGVAAPSAPATESTSESEPQSEMVLVEAPPEQIEQILVSCSQDTEAIEEVEVDPTASGVNNAPQKQRLLDYRQYSRGAENRGKAKGYSITPAQQGVIAVLNSLPQEQSVADSAIEDGVQQGWAARVPAEQRPEKLQELNTRYNQFRNQYYYGQLQQQATTKSEALNHAKKLSKGKFPAEQPMRVLFLLHPSEDAAKK